MASTAIPDSEITEYRDSAKELSKKIDKLAQFVVAAKGEFVVYTGAGISTNAGIPDFRGPNGVWTLKAKGLAPTRSKSLSEVHPTLTHMALVGLLQNGFLSYVVSQNCDGLHLRSGIPPESISELHGNCNAEACPDCGEVYWRPERARTQPNVYCYTDRKCRREGCDGDLRYTTVAFGQSMPDLSLHRAELHSRTAKLSLTMGTSMRVQPACELPGLAKKRSKGKIGKLVIVNFQKTPYDDLCDLRIFADCDQVMQMLCERLALTIPETADLCYEPDREKLRTWYAGFKKNWVFRTADPTHSWCSPKPTKKKVPKTTPTTSTSTSTSASASSTEDKGGYVQPSRSCKHVEHSVSDIALSIEEAKSLLNEKHQCEECHGKEELWLCLACKKLFCGRYQKGHAVQHAESDMACQIAISLSDLNTWCYQCDQYVIHDAIVPHYIVFYLAKFGTLPPGYKFKGK